MYSGFSYKVSSFRMSSQIDFKTLPANVPVMCISRVYPNISESRIRRIFDELDMGIIDRIDMVSKENEKGEKFNRIFIHFQRWNDTENGRISRERLLNGKEIKIIYDDPWFWKISAYMKPEHKPNSYQPKPQQQRAKPTIQFDSDDEDEKPREEKPKYQERPKYQEKPKYQERPQKQYQKQYRDERPQKQYQEQYKDERPQKQYQEQYKDERPQKQYQEQYKDERPRQQKQYKQYKERPQKQYKEERPRPKSMVDNDLLTEEQEKHAVNYNVDPKKPPMKKMRKQNLSLETKSKPLNIEDLNTEDLNIEDLNTEDNSKGEVEDGEVEDV